MNTKLKNASMFNLKGLRMCVLYINISPKIDGCVIMMIIYIIKSIV